MFLEPIEDSRSFDFLQNIVPIVGETVGALVLRFFNASDGLNGNHARTTDP